MTFFNLAFGDWDEETKWFDDKAVSNNSDRTKILATVAAAVLEFTEFFPDMSVLAVSPFIEKYGFPKEIIESELQRRQKSK